MNYKKVVRYLIIILIVGYIVYLGTMFFTFFSDAKKVFNDHKSVKTALESDYQRIFNNNYRDKIFVDEILSSKTRNDIASLIFDSAYFMILYRIDLNEDGSMLSKVLDVKTENTHRTYNVTYSGLKNAFEFRYIVSNKIKRVQRIYCSITCDSLDTVISNDSMVNYSADFKKLSIGYGDGIKDIYVTSDDDAFISPKCRLSVCFLKRGEYVYLVLMAPVNPKVSMSRDLLYKILK